ncbi:hypothetical protein B0O80DRAFT_495671 [Mortierella sp. GBAus27b]|nr:hypothetical protein B0O80DRAFT_495671 [Mortierella sp. GBAus27b]
MATASSSQQQEQVFEKFEAYDFENDVTFQAGLKSIVSNNQNRSEKEQQEAIQNARYFYFARFIQNFDHSQYKEWRAQRSSSTGVSSEERRENKEQEQGSSMQVESQSSSAEVASNTAASDPSYPKSFQEICELIATGQPIPGIRQIPNNLAEGTPSEPAMAPRLKPWEQKKAATAPASASTSGTQEEPTLNA